MTRRALTLAALLLAVLPAATASAARGDITNGKLTLAYLGSVPGPTDLAFAPNDPTTVYATERRGRIVALTPGRTPRVRVVADLRSAVLSRGEEQGLLALAFSPTYARDHLAYVWLTATRAGDRLGSVEQLVELKRWKLNRLLLTVDHPFVDNHNGGDLAFAADKRHLFVSVGDGSGEGDADFTAQNDAVLLGKLLRVDVRTGAVAIWAKGLRNTFRFSLDGDTLWLADVGQARYEEVDASPASRSGLNYGWPYCEGTFSFTVALKDQVTPRCARPGITLPIFQYPHARKFGPGAVGCSIIGGYVVRDPRFATRVQEDLRGRYVYADFCTGQISTLRRTAHRATDVRAERFLGFQQIDTFGEDARRRVYVTGQKGKVYRLDPVARR